MPIPPIPVKHDNSAYHWAMHELGLIQTTANNNSEEVEVQIYKKEVDADRSGTIEKDRETLDADGSGRIQPVEVWGFFTRNMDWLTKDGVLNVIISLREKIKYSSHPSLPGSELYKAYHALFTRALESKDEDIRAKGQEAMDAFNHVNLPAAKTEKEEAVVFVAPPPPENLQMCIERTELPEGYIEHEIAEVTEKKTGERRRAIVDGDTIKVLCYGKIEKSKTLDKLGIDQDVLWSELLAAGYIDASGKTQEKLYMEIDNVSLSGEYATEQRREIIGILKKALFGGIRFKGVNTTEFGKGPNLKSRLGGAEPGAINAWEELKGLLKLADFKVYVRPERKDSYGRFVSQVFVAAPGGKFIDIEAFLVSRGLGMVYFVQVADPQAYSCLLALQAQAQKEKKGIWSLPEFWDDPEGKNFKPFRITSFHANAKRDKEDDEPLYNEYFRIVNTSDRTINLKDYKIFNKKSGKTVSLPDFIVTPGRTVKIATGGIATSAGSDILGRELILSLDFSEPFWENKEEGGACLIIQDLNGRTIDSSAQYGYKGCE